MNVVDAINTRRAYRSLEPVEITDEMVRDLATHAGLAPSCNNNQPWRFVFVRDPGQLAKVHAALTKNNKWIELASMIVAVFSRAGEDCNVKERVYHQFDTGMGTAFLILRATELGSSPTRSPATTRPPSNRHSASPRTTRSSRS